MDEQQSPTLAKRAPRSGLSYKFQRLREKLRQAIASGELSGKLPGERALAKRFHVNAKTLSKALTDLAAEGLLDRSIGRGTYVKGHAPTAATTKRWLIVCDTAQLQWETVQLIRDSHPDVDVTTDVSQVRPSYLNQFSAVIDIADNTPDSFLRNLVVRNIPVVVLGKQPKTFSTHAVLFDGPLAVSMLARDLMLGGHRRIAAVEPPQCTVVADTLRSAAARYAPNASIDGCYPDDVAAMIENGTTAFVCQSPDIAAEVKQQLDKLNVAVPTQVSLVAIGSSSENLPCTGYFLNRSEKVSAIVQLLADTQSYRPTSLWLAGRYTDKGTSCPLAYTGVESDSAFTTLSA